MRIALVAVAVLTGCGSSGFPAVKYAKVDKVCQLAEKFVLDRVGKTSEQDRADLDRLVERCIEAFESLSE